ncbi:hypothetical protein M0R45_024579 [Rubus argutus]|uniref:Uncharacterized protein n=1 Tax=Rubus argutus TaxID=59490 RepID=A0AAW1WRH0_RUBAR
MLYLHKRNLSFPRRRTSLPRAQLTIPSSFAKPRSAPPLCRDHHLTVAASPAIQNVPSHHRDNSLSRRTEPSRAAPSPSPPCSPCLLCARRRRCLPTVPRRCRTPARSARCRSILIIFIAGADPSPCSDRRCNQAIIASGRLFKLHQAQHGLF